MINFPNTPISGQTFLDNNGKSWIFNFGYWHEIIPNFSINLLRDVNTNPTINDLLVWDGTNWINNQIVYNISDIIGFPATSNNNDVLVWKIDKYVSVPLINFVSFTNSYQKKYLSEIEGNMSTSIYDSFVQYNFDTILISNDTNMVDFINNKLVCTSAGIYKLYLFFESLNADPNHYYYPELKLKHLDSIGTELNVWYKKGNSIRSNNRTYSVFDNIIMNVGDTISFDFVRRWDSYFNTTYTSNLYGRMSLFKIGDIQTINPSLSLIINIDSTINDLSSPVVRLLEPGTYSIQPIDGYHKSINRWNIVFACDVNGENCTKGYSWALDYHSSDFTKRTYQTTNGYFSTAQKGFDDILTISPKTFIISSSQNVYFYFDDGTMGDNIGGISFSLDKIL